MTKPGETDNYKASDHIKALSEHISPELVKYCIMDTAETSNQLLKKYELEDSCPVSKDKENIKKFNCKIFESDLLNTEGGRIRHDPVRTSRLIFSVIQDYKKSRLYGR